MIYDVIGDIHGHADALKGLLHQLGYRLTSNPNIKRHSNSQDAKQHLPKSYFAPPEGHRAMFIGDLIDRGPQELETLEIVFAMIDAGVADAVMGNHEYNALAYATLDEFADTINQGHYLRAHNNAHFRQHKAFLEEIPFGSEAHQYWLSRFYELPLWIETQEACFVHACWHQDKMKILKPLLTQNNCLTPEGLQRTGQKDTEEYDALERVLKGVEMPLPEGVTFSDKEGTVRRRMRVKWWLEDIGAKRHHHIVDIARAAPSDLAQIPAGATIDHVDFVLQTDKPVFVGHYWLTGTPEPLSQQVVCTDYSVAGNGYLTAYQFDTHNPWPLSKDNFVQYRP